MDVENEGSKYGGLKETQYSQLLIEFLDLVCNKNDLTLLDKNEIKTLWPRKVDIPSLCWNCFGAVQHLVSTSQELKTLEQRVLELKSKILTAVKLSTRTAIECGNIEHACIASGVRDKIRGFIVCGGENKKKEVKCRPKSKKLVTKNEAVSIPAQTQPPLEVIKLKKSVAIDMALELERSGSPVLVQDTNDDVHLLRPRNKVAVNCGDPESFSDSDNDQMSGIEDSFCDDLLDPDFIPETTEEFMNYEDGDQKDIVSELDGERLSQTDAGMTSPDKETQVTQQVLAITLNVDKESSPPAKAISSRKRKKNYKKVESSHDNAISSRREKRNPKNMTKEERRAFWIETKIKYWKKVRALYPSHLSDTKVKELHRASRPARVAARAERDAKNRAAINERKRIRELKGRLRRNAKVNSDLLRTERKKRGEQK